MNVSQKYRLIGSKCKRFFLTNVGMRLEKASVKRFHIVSSNLLQWKTIAAFNLEILACCFHFA